MAGARTVIRAFVKAFGLALATIFVLLSALLRSLADASRALVPLLLGSVMLAALAALTPMRFNFANIIVLPSLLHSDRNAPIRS